MKTPDVTPVQMLVGVVQAALALAVAFGLNLSDVQTASILGFTATIGAFALYADARIRSARAMLSATREQNETTLALQRTEQERWDAATRSKIADPPVF